MSAPHPFPAISTTRLSAAALLAGAVTSWAYPPHGLWFLAPVSGAAMALSALHAAHPRSAFCAGAAFGLALYGATLSWLYTGIRASDAPFLAYGAPLALIVAFSSAPAAVAYLACAARRIGVGPLALTVLLIPGLWTLAEWLRHFSSFRFPWAHVGYTQVADSPFAVFAPLAGALGLSLVTVLIGSLLIVLAMAVSVHVRIRALAALIVVGTLTCIGGATEWTQPVGAPVPVALFQGAFRMSEKFQAATVVQALEAYGAAARDSTARVAILPETALPLLEHQLPEGYLASLNHVALSEDRDVLLSFFRNASDGQPGYFSSARVLGSSGTQTRDKRILVPFGEYVPAASWLRALYERIATVPLLDTVPGSHDQGGIILGGVRVALKLCFEDLFPDLFRAEVAAARFIVVLANDSWDGSNAPMHQHLQISQTRAAEAAKPLIRVANTGWSALIGPDGRLVAVAPPDQPAMLEVSVQPREGITPYTRHGDAIPVGLATLAVVIALASADRARRTEIAQSEIAA